MKQTRQITVGGVKIGGGAPVVIQSMTNTDTRDAGATLAQIRALADAGVETAGKHRGMHSLRHSAATNMLSGGTPYPTISSVLGHSSVNVTKRYLSIDVESLRPLALEVPTCR